ncbi:MAG: outer membrane protein transport protein [Gammaproteobacteria bacterium]|nr:outer membrane protein transport protein [Gammaproteobacteria bacterium]
MNKIFNGFTAAAVVVGLCVAGNAFATNGYFTHGNGTKNKSMAGAGIALPEDAIDITNNPAVAPFVGDQLIVGAALFSPVRKYETSSSLANGMGGAFTIGPNRLTSDSEYFVIPHIAKSWQLQNDAAWALSFYGRGGMNTDWQGGTATFDPDGPGPGGTGTFPGTYGDGIFGGSGKAGVNLSQAFLDVTWAKQVNPKLSLGISAVLVAQYFKANGVRTFGPYTRSFAASGATQQPTSLSNNGTDWSYGAGVKLGLHSQLSERVSFGIMYQSKIWMSEFDDYADLFAEQGDFDIPADLKVGLSIQANEKVALSFDIEHMWYSDVAAVGNPIQGLFACPTAGMGGTALENCLGGDNGGGFGWDDMTVYKAGLRWKAGEDWTWRFGYSYGKQPIEGGLNPMLSQMSFNILAPATIEQHVTAGFTLERTPGRQFNMAFMYAPNSDVTGVQNFDPTQTVTFEMYQWEIEASYSWRF